MFYKIISKLNKLCIVNKNLKKNIYFAWDEVTAITIRI